MDLTSEESRAPGASCYSKVAFDTYAHVLCQWHRDAWVDVATWTFERDGNAWRPVEETDGVVR